MCMYVCMYVHQCLATGGVASVINRASARERVQQEEYEITRLVFFFFPEKFSK